MEELLLKEADARLGLAPISHIKTSLDRILGSNEWIKWEPETISIELGMAMDELLLDKIQVLQIIEQAPTLFFEDPAFMLYATEVLNNNVADFESVPVPSSLELAFAISEIRKVLAASGKTPTFNDAFAKAVAWMLREEGYSKPVAPFDFVPEDMLEHGQTEADTEAKKKAIDAYIEHMESL